MDYGELRSRGAEMRMRAGGSDDDSEQSLFFDRGSGIGSLPTYAPKHWMESVKKGRNGWLPEKYSPLLRFVHLEINSPGEPGRVHVPRDDSSTQRPVPHLLRRRPRTPPRPFRPQNPLQNRLLYFLQ